MPVALVFHEMSIKFHSQSEHPSLSDGFYDFLTQNGISTRTVARKVAEPPSLPFQENRKNSISLVLLNRELRKGHVSGASTIIIIIFTTM